MTGKHTPGPWNYAARDHRQIRSAKSYIGMVYKSRNAKEDGHLIAAAPDLLEALTDLLQVNDGIPMLGVEASRRIDAARAAIAKATGGAA